MLDKNKLCELVNNLKKLEEELEKIQWENEDKKQEYNELQDEIIDYLKGVQWD